MSRRIDTGSVPTTPSGSLSYLGMTGEGDDYLSRLAKYIPAEIVGLYLATSGVIPPEPSGAPRWSAMWIIFLLNFAFVPLYFLFATTRNQKKPLWSQVILSSIAFPVWVFAIGGPFKAFPWYQGWIASVTLAFTTVAFGFYQPQPGA